MIPNVNRKNGASFRGAGKYYLHDKAAKGAEHPTSSTRVAWTAVRNLVHADPHQAIDEMWRTAEDARELKKQSGHRWQGEKGANPVKTISLSWAPHQSPTQAQMEATVDHYLKAMGWQDHQALLIAHNDTPHPHVHIILNCVHPETGLMLNDWRDWQRSQRWGLAIEREQGEVLCLARVEKYEKGFDLQPNGMPYPFAKLVAEHERGFESVAADAAIQKQAEKHRLAERHRIERENFLGSAKSQFRQVRQEAYRDVRDEYKPFWRDFHRRRKDMQRKVGRQTRDAFKGAASLAREGDYERGTQLIDAAKERERDARDDFRGQKQGLRERQFARTKEHQDERCQSLYELRKLGFQEIKDRQKEERAEFKELIALRDAGAPHDIRRLEELLRDAPDPRGANDNELPLDFARSTKEAVRAAQGPDLPFNPFSQAAHELFGRHGYAEKPDRSPKRDLTDVGIAAIGAAIEFGVRLMEGLISGPSPLEQAIAKAYAAREAVEAPRRRQEAREEKIRDDFMRHAYTAVREADAERDKRRTLDHEERGRSRYRER